LIIWRNDRGADGAGTEWGTSDGGGGEDGVLFDSAGDGDGGLSLGTGSDSDFVDLYRCVRRRGESEDLEGVGVVRRRKNVGLIADAWRSKRLLNYIMLVSGLPAHHILEVDSDKCESSDQLGLMRTSGSMKSDS
jgi:hypothetical protein